MTATATAPADWRTRSANQTRLAFGQALLELGEREPRTVVLSADTQDLLGIRPYIERYRERFVEVGIAEQNAIGIAAGLATTGLRPYVCAYAPFITARSMEQVRNDVAYANQRVVIGAAASGISLGVAGGTHHALEDLALMRSLPNMTVIVPADVADPLERMQVLGVHVDGGMREWLHVPARKLHASRWPRIFTQ
jgi:transketolase